MDERDEYGYGYRPKGECIEALKSGRRTGRIKMIAAYCQRTLLAPFTVEGTDNRTVFETCLVNLSVYGYTEITRSPTI
ncbi:MAG: hypothetical protein F6K30_21025 [Cyanothece sp. SIO2G6]|nr:hypothetical protein [Cyanothece sp. SIO2G6]